MHLRGKSTTLCPTPVLSRCQAERAQGLYPDTTVYCGCPVNCYHPHATVYHRLRLQMVAICAMLHPYHHTALNFRQVVIAKRLILGLWVVTFGCECVSNVWQSIRRFSIEELLSCAIMLRSTATEALSLIGYRPLRATRALIKETEVASGEKVVFMNFETGSTAIR